MGTNNHGQLKRLAAVEDARRARLANTPLCVLAPGPVEGQFERADGSIVTRAELEREAVAMGDPGRIYLVIDR